MHRSGRVLAIDAVGALHGGAARVVQAAVAGALRADVDEAIVFLSDRRKRRFSIPTHPRLRVVEVARDGGGAQRIWWQAAGAREACRRTRATHVLFLGGGGMADECVVRGVLIQQSVPFVPEGLARHGVRDKARFAAIAAMMSWSVSGADVVCVQTETMREAVRDRFGVEDARIRVARAGLGAVGGVGRRESTRHRTTSGYVRILYVGNDSPYKNLSVVSRAVEVLVIRKVQVVLVATVRHGTLAGTSFEQREIGYVGDGDLAAEYANADCLVMPSLSETICLPLVEAMGVGLPVVVADRPYAREVCDGAGFYFDPLSPKDLARAVLEATAERAERDRRIEEGYRRAAFWSSPAAYDELIGAVLEAR